MASVAPPTRTPAPRPESFVEAQLRSARGRIVLRDVLTAGLVLTLITLVYGVTLVVLDVNLHLPNWVRQVSFGAYLFGAGTFAYFTLVRPLMRPVNPFFAAQRVEQTVPNAKNSVINWLDLHDEAVPETTRTALSQRAAKALKQADLNEAVPQRSVAWLGGAVAAAVIVALIVLIKLGGTQLGSLVGRAFSPFADTPIAAQTGLTVVDPANGHLTISLNRLNQSASSVQFTVHAEGRIPEPGRTDSIRLLYRYSDETPVYEPPHPLEADRGDNRVWRLRFPSNLVQNGFWYKVAVGTEGSADYAETPEYRVQVRANPLVTNFEVTYRYRPYRAKPPLTVRSPDGEIADYRGTEVAVVAYTNRNVREGRLVMAATPALEPVTGERVPGQPNALRFKFGLERSASYQVHFIAEDGEPTVEPMPVYHVRVEPDKAPDVRVTEPKDLDKPLPVTADGTLPVAGSAADDFGVTKFELKMQIKGGPLLTKPYRPGKDFKLADGTYPQQMDYRDFVELDKLTGADGKSPLKLTEGLEIEYWLEATDNFDLGPNVGRSKQTFKAVVTAKPPDAPPQQQQQARQQAQQQQQNHEAKQDQRQQQQNQAAQQRKEQQEKQGGGEPQQGQQNENQQNQGGGQPQQGKPQDQQGQPQPNQQPQPGGQQTGQPQQNQQPQEGPQTGQPQQNQANNNQQQQQQPGGQGAAGQPQPNQQPPAGQPNQQQPMGQGEPMGQPQGQNNANAQPNPGAGGQQGDAQRDQQIREKAEKANRAIEQMNQQQQKPGAPNNPGGQPQQQPNAAPKPGAQDQQPGQPPPGAPPQQQQPMGGGATQPPQQPQGQPGQPMGQPNQGQRPDGQPNPQQQPGQQAPQPMGGTGEPPMRPGQPNQQPQGTPPQAGQPNQQPMPGGQPPQQPGQANPQPQAGQPMGQPNQQPQGTPQPGQPNQQPMAGGQQQPLPGQPMGQQDQQSQGGQPQAGSKPDAAAQQKVEPSARQQPGASENNPKPQPGAGQQQQTPMGQKPPEAGEPKGQNEDPAAAKDPQSGNGNNPRAAGGQSNAKPPQTTQNQSPMQGGQQGTGQNPQANAGQQQPGNRNAGQPMGTQAGNDKKPQPGAAPTAEDVKRMAEALKNGNAEVRRAAAEELDAARRQAAATDPAVQKAAEEALKEAARQGNKQAQDALAGNNERQPGQQPGAGDQQPGQQPMPGTQPGQQGTDPQPMAGGQPKPMEAQQPGQQPGQQPTGQGQGGQPGQQGQPGSQTQGPGDPPKEFKPGPGGTDTDLGPGQAPNREFQRRAGELQLEEFRKQAKNKEFLKEMKMDEAEYEQFMKGYKEMLDRQQAQQQAEDSRPFAAGNRAGGSGLNTGGPRRVQPGGTGRPGETENAGAALPPPEYRKAYQEFTEELSKPKRDKR